MRACVVLTSAESKRLIAKAVAQMDEVKYALRNGLIVITRGTTSAFVAEEILGKELDKAAFAGGLVIPMGLCINKTLLREIVIERGKVREDLSYADAVDKLGAGDVYIKSANALDPYGNVGILLAGRDGGTIGRAIGTIVARGVSLIIPVGLEKSIPARVFEVSREMGQERLDYSMGLPVGYMPLRGKVVSEVEAIKILSGAEALPVASGGVCGAEGAVTLLILGGEDNVNEAIKIVESVKGEPQVKAYPADCEVCDWKNCHMQARRLAGKSV